MKAGKPVGARPKRQRRRIRRTSRTAAENMVVAAAPPVDHDHFWDKVAACTDDRMREKTERL